MALTRAYAETVIVARLKGLLSAASMAVTYAGSNADLSSSLAWAARRMGLSPSNPTTVTDSDLSGLGADDYDDYLDLAEYRALQDIQGRLAALVNIAVGPRNEQLGQMAVAVGAMIAAKAAHVESISSPVSVGYIQQDFVAVPD